MGDLWVPQMTEEGYGVSPGRRVGTTKEEGIVLVQENYLEVQQ